MRLGLRELRRRPGRFGAATAILTLIALLLMFIGGLLDGLLASSTGAYRAQDADLVVYSGEARRSLVRSSISPETRAAVEDVEGVEATGGLASVQLGARVDDPASDDLVSTALFAYEMAPRGLPDEPPAEGEVIADDSLRADGVEEGDELLLGPSRSPVTVVGFVDDTRYAGPGTLWGSFGTWAGVTAANRPDQVVAEGDVQALVVRTDASRNPADVADAIDAAVDGQTETLTLAAAVDALPGVSQQRSTFNQIIGVTLVVALVVVGLFFALITVERVALYGILAAIGASGPTLFAGVVVQAVVVTSIAAATGAAAAVALDLVLPPGALPFTVTSGRLLASGCLLLVAAILGSAFSLRRVLRIDPASAIGTAS